MYFGFSGSTGVIRSHQYILGWALAIGEKAQSLDISKVLLCSQSDPEKRPSMEDVTEYLEQKKSIPDISFDTAEFGLTIANEISHETATTQGTTSSFYYDTTILLSGR
ncbi:Concanavalin A-like lectin/glucanase domain superfamily [Arabidopsis suecica]|uniref:Concanavalin A-like lectin/glucanase domain superfamily n=1 Tax=Arabidopsis suecica TaxID=45249 RepID=A0A8T1ZYT8_ARASU|nr:Concanavalin A-like lectin/glucanase domain superfamily [Arabidopsis suecica]